MDLSSLRVAAVKIEFSKLRKFFRINERTREDGGLMIVSDFEGRIKFHKWVKLGAAVDKTCNKAVGKGYEDYFYC